MRDPNMKEKTVFERPVSRRRVLTASALLAAAGFASSPLAAAVANAVADFGVYEWTACVINCGQRCPLRAYTKNGTVIRIETDNTVKDGCRVRQLRACLKGRDMRERLYSPDRLKYPMKRVGERGEGRFERISWDEALKTVADKLRETVEKYGNESLYWQYCSGQQSLVNSRRAWWRLLNLCGGYLKYYGSYSTAQISAAFPMTYGASPSSDISEIANAKLYVTFGHNPAVTRGSGHGKSWQMTCTREAEGGRKPKMIVIDPIYSDTAVAHADEWIPIRPGTDAALVEAIAHELIVHDRVDHAFLAQYCVGYDEGTLPASAPKGSDYKSHILGRGPDGIEKTPEWASRITGVPVETIVRLAEEIGTTKPVFFSQGWGPQRQANGEQTSRAIAMLPILTGNVGLPGTIRSRRFARARSPRAIRSTPTSSRSSRLEQKEIEHDKAIRFRRRRLALHGLQDLRRCMQGRAQSARRPQSAPRARRSFGQLASGPHDGRLASGRSRLVRLDRLQPLREPGMRQGLPDQGALQARRGRPRRHRPRQVHRLRHVRAGLPLRCASAR